LHLSTVGEILPHVDNVEASGPHILGVSLGATRIMRMDSKVQGAGLGFDVLLPSGSVYVQRFVRTLEVLLWQILDAN
jgi:alkylated DNA repair protein alkB homolog 7